LTSTKDRLIQQHDAYRAQMDLNIQTTLGTVRDLSHQVIETMRERITELEAEVEELKGRLEDAE